jgi:aminopeptidase YwaD
VNAEVAGAWVLETQFSPQRVEVAAGRGAVGVLVQRGTDGAGWLPKMIAGPATEALLVLAVRADLHEAMRAAAHGSAVTAAVPVRTVDVTGTNVHGVFRPRRGGLSLLLAAHFDAVGDEPDGPRFRAACDNAAGVAAVLEAAGILHRVLRDDIGLAVALLDGEEAGARGWGRHAPSVQPGTFVINLDGAAQLGEAAAVEAGGPARPLLAALDLAGRQVGVPSSAGAMPSDKRRYAAAGLPAVGIGMGMPGYQTPAEAPDRVDDATLTAAATLLAATAVSLAGGFNLSRPNPGPAPPRWSDRNLSTPAPWPRS